MALWADSQGTWRTKVCGPHPPSREEETRRGMAANGHPVQLRCLDTQGHVCAPDPPASAMIPGGPFTLTGPSTGAESQLPLGAVSSLLREELVPVPLPFSLPVGI